MNDHLNIFTSQQDLPFTIEEIKLYCIGKADRGLVRRIELRMIDDPFFADAMEGYMRCDNWSEVEKQVKLLKDEINTQYLQTATIKENTEDNRSFFQLKYIAIAASVLILFGIGYIVQDKFLSSDTPTVASTTTSAPEQWSPATTDTSIDHSIADAQSTSADVEGSNIVIQSQESITPLEPAKPTTIAPIMITEAEVQEDAKSDIQVEKKESMLGDGNYQVTSEAAAPKITEPISSGTVAQEESYDEQNKDKVTTIATKSVAARPSANTAPAAPTVAEGIAKYEAKKYDEAEKNLSEVLANDPQNQKAISYRSQTRSKKKNCNGAYNDFKKMETNYSNPDYLAAAWEAAYCMRSSNKSKAREILQKLIDHHTSYATQAQELLDQL